MCAHSHGKTESSDRVAMEVRGRGQGDSFKGILRSHYVRVNNNFVSCILADF